MSCARAVAVLLFASLFVDGPLIATAPLSPDQARVLDLVRSYALDYTAKLPDFICTQITLRETFLMNSVDHGSLNTHVTSDVIEERLTFSNQKESYEVLSLNGSPVTGVKHTQITGAISAGEFGSLLRDILDLNTHAIFEWDRMSGPRDHRLYVFAFRVPKESGIHVVDKASGHDTVASYHGRIFVNAGTNEVERIDSQVDFPPEFALKAAKRSVEYKRVSIGGQDYSLPFHSEVQMLDATYLYRNRMDYRAYHRYEVTSRMRVGVALNGPEVANSGPNPAPVRGDPQAVNLTSPLDAPLQTGSGEPVGTAEAAHPLAAPEIIPPSPLPPSTELKSGTSLPSASVEAKIESPAPANAVETPPTAEPPPSHDQPTVLRTQVNIVLVPVVVRNDSGRPVGDLTKEDFQLFDRGKPQQITNFSVQKRRSDEAAKVPASSPGQLHLSVAADLPSNFVAYWFDDMHLSASDLTRVRDAVLRNLETLQASDRVAIFTSSGQGNLDFTSDREKLQDALMKLRPRPPGEPAGRKCPDISYYMADLIFNKRDAAAFEQATDDTLACMHASPLQRQIVEGQVQSEARAALITGQQASRGSLVSLKEVILKLSVMPGSRSLLVLSPGFFFDTDMQFAEQDVLDLALRHRAVISSLDARGVYVLNPAGDIEHDSGDARSSIARADYARNDAAASSSILASLAAGTGGTFIQNTNDLSGGFQRLMEVPEYSYLLEFTLQDLKNDEKFHPIKVKLRSRKKLTVQARSGYFAPKQAITQ
jgi:VWFA-related protein